MLDACAFDVAAFRDRSLLLMVTVAGCAVTLLTVCAVDTVCRALPALAWEETTTGCMELGARFCTVLIGLVRRVAVDVVVCMASKYV